MAIREILLFPDPRLRIVSEAVTEGDPELPALIEDLKDTLSSRPGCVGIAAPQIGVSRRVVLVDASRYRKKVVNQGLLVLLNPRILEASGEILTREGCLSLPDYTANITRPRTVTLTHGTPDHSATLAAADFEAVVIQHEMDHLEGILFLDRVKCVKSDLFRRKKFV